MFDMVLAGGIIAVIVLFFIALFYVLGAAILSWAWNMFIPLVWHSAPLIGFWPALALLVLISTIKGIFSSHTTVNKGND